MTVAAQFSSSTWGFSDLDTSSLFRTVNVFPFLRFRLQNQSNVFSLSALGFCSTLKTRIPSNLTGLLAGHYISKLLIILYGWYIVKIFSVWISHITYNLHPHFFFLRETKHDIKNTDDRYNIHIFISVLPPPLPSFWMLKTFSCTDIHMRAYSDTYIFLSCYLWSLIIIQPLP